MSVKTKDVRRVRRLSVGLGYLVRDAQRAFTRELAEAFEPHGISPAQYYYLRALWERDGVSQVELSARLGVERASATAVLQSLEQLGLIERVQDRSDLRKLSVHLTPRGVALQRPILACTQRVNAKATKGFAEEEVARALDFLRGVAANLDEAEPEVASS
jgi:DNA-binding MarR family transcriptional regulator